MYYYAHYIRGIGAYSPDFLSIVQFGVFWSTFSVNFLFRIYIYKYLNDIDMILLRTIAIGTGSSSSIILNCNLVRLGVYMVKLCHEKILILRCILTRKTEPPPGKN